MLDELVLQGQVVAVDHGDHDGLQGIGHTHQHVGHGQAAEEEEYYDEEYYDEDEEYITDESIDASVEEVGDIADDDEATDDVAEDVEE